MSRKIKVSPAQPEVILALDVDTFKEAKHFINKLYPKIKIFKVGIHFFTACGPEIIEFIHKLGAQVFLDLKFFDIPNTVASAVRVAVNLRVKMLTLHILGGQDMLKQAVIAAREEAGRLKVKRPLLIGVTVLTSKKTTSSNVLTLARVGIESGLDGVVCSVKEIPLLRKKIKRIFVTVTPGIRPGRSGHDDQKRVATVKDAVSAGSNFLVIGRPILRAKQPLRAAEELLGDI
ncbi:MAG: orotidine-5'-phosphate decarboxylase [Candidatus Omnitrophica bacterium]|nr:orotidine-5'-phosphate decarboxylase [Candidatus Omnitrophota bacterium]